MSRLELIAAGFGVLSVWLSTRENIWSWPTAIVNVLLYVIVFREAKLYADMWLQVIYAIISVYGWWHWLHGGAGDTVLPVTRTPPRLMILLGVIAVATSAILGLLFARYSDAALPWVDSSLSATSLVAQWMLTRKLLENWLVWIGLNVCYIGMFAFKQLYPTVGQTIVFLVLAVMGYRAWRRSMAESPVVAPA